MTSTISVFCEIVVYFFECFAAVYYRRDFRTVRQEQFYLADEQTNLDRIAALREECALKKDGNKTNRIGFSA